MSKCAERRFLASGYEAASLETYPTLCTLDEINSGTPTSNQPIQIIGNNTMPGFSDHNYSVRTLSDHTYAKAVPHIGTATRTDKDGTAVSDTVKNTSEAVLFFDKLFDSVNGWGSIKKKKGSDIGANLTDDMYQGVYHGSTKHAPDLDSVLKRSWDAGLDRVIVTGGSLSESREALVIAQSNSRLFSTVGCHPTRCQEFVADPEVYLRELKELIREGGDKVVAIGECGLDYERLQFCTKDVQQKYFEYQLHLSSEFSLPLFLHCRAAADDLVDILSRNRELVQGGVVHSFDGSQGALEKILELGLYVGINGCSLRTAENIEVASKIPSDRLMLETDSPWCEVKPTHAGYCHVRTKHPAVKKEKHTPGNLVKGRNEPCNIVQVLEILAAIRKQDPDELAEAAHDNTNRLFFKKIG